MVRKLAFALPLLAAAMGVGCRSTNRAGGEPTVSFVEPKPAEVTQVAFDDVADNVEASRLPDSESDSAAPPTLVGPVTDAVAPTEQLPAPNAVEDTAEEVFPGDSLTSPQLDQVLESTRQHFPLVRQALAGRAIAAGQVLEASGAFDHKLDLFSQAQPLDFYENYQGKLGVKRDTIWGGSTFAEYKIGRGTFEPWFEERSSNDGGEFSVGFFAPLVRDRVIDANRSALWQAQVERTRVEADIRRQMIFIVRDASFAYWEWIAAGANLRIAEDVLKLGEDRRRLLEGQVKAGETEGFNVKDNERIIFQRAEKVNAARQKLRQAAIKLSLFFRDPQGRPRSPESLRATLDFPLIDVIDPSLTDGDVAIALANRPELAEVRAVDRQLRIAANQARNEILPDVDAGVKVAQDVGQATSSKRDKSEFELEATVTLSVPLERRKARGKLRQLEAKRFQVLQKLQFSEEKITTEVGVAREGVLAASQRVELTSRGLEYAREIVSLENRRFREGEIDYFVLNRREKDLADAATAQVQARFEFEVALAQYAAALGLDNGRLDAFDAGAADESPDEADAANEADAAFP